MSNASSCGSYTSTQRYCVGVPLVQKHENLTAQVVLVDQKGQVVMTEELKDQVVLPVLPVHRVHKVRLVRLVIREPLDLRDHKDHPVTVVSPATVDLTAPVIPVLVTTPAKDMAKEGARNE
jgi:hypothetical protein